MTWQQAFVVAWIQFAVAAAVLLCGALVAVRRLRQPAERARLVPVVLSAALAVPLLAALSPWPVWNLGWIDAPRAVPTRVAAAPQSPREPATQPPLAATVVRDHVVADSDPGGVVLERRIPQEPQPAPREPWSAWSWAAFAILVAHAATASLFLAGWCVGRWQLRRLCRAASIPQPHVGQIWQHVAGERAARVRLLESADVDAPLAFGWLRPTVVIPTRIATQNIVGLRYCLAHEWSHIDRGDLRVSAFVRGCRYLLWYQPVYWLLSRELRLCQEFLADQRSAVSEDDRVEYSELLLSLARSRMAAPVAGALNLLDQPSELGRRVRLLLEGTMLAGRCRRRVAWTALVASLAAASAFSMVRPEAAVAEPEPEQPAETGKAESGTTQAKAEAPPAKFHPSVAEFKAAQERDAQPGALPAALNYTGRVVEKYNNKPIAGASVVVRRSDSSTSLKPLEESKHTTDADGKFSFTIPPEQVAAKRLYIELDVEHPDYAAKKGFGYGLSMIVKNEALGSPPFFALTELLPAEPVTGTVLGPDGRPLEGVKVQGFCRARLNDWQDHSFVDTRTGADGTFRLPLVKGGFAVVWVLPKDYAIVQRYLGKDRGDLGEFRLEPGVRSAGQVVDVAGKPVANVAVNIQEIRSSDNDEFNRLAVSTSVRRAAITDAEGRFAYDPLPPGEYQIDVEDSPYDPLREIEGSYPFDHVFMPQKVTLSADSTEPLRMQAVPHVVFEAQYYNSRGEKTNGHGPRLWGKVNGVFWHAGAEPKDGHILLKVPHGLENGRLQLSTNEHSSLRYRLKKDEPLKSDKIDIELGTFNDDMQGVEIIRYVAPIVVVKAVDEAGQPIEAFRVAAAYPWGQQRYILEGETRSDLSFERQPGGWRSEQLLPDEEVKFTAMAEGYEDASQSLSMPEGEFKELVLTLKKKPATEEAAAQAVEPKPEDAAAKE